MGCTEPGFKDLRISSSWIHVICMFVPHLSMVFSLCCLSRIWGSSHRSNRIPVLNCVIIPSRTNSSDNEPNRFERDLPSCVFRFSIHATMVGFEKTWRCVEGWVIGCITGAVLSEDASVAVH